MLRCPTCQTAITFVLVLSLTVSSLVVLVDHIVLVDVCAADMANALRSMARRIIPIVFAARGARNRYRVASKSSMEQIIILNVPRNRNASPKQRRLPHEKPCKWTRRTARILRTSNLWEMQLVWMLLMERDGRALRARSLIPRTLLRPVVRAVLSASFSVLGVRERSSKFRDWE